MIITGVSNYYLSLPAQRDKEPAPDAAVAQSENPPAASTPVESALETIFANDPQVVAFGEVHKQNRLSYPSTARHFAEDILPRLPEYGIRDLVLEVLPDDPVIDAELETFRQTGRLTGDTPWLWQWLDGPGMCANIRILEIARENGIIIHGGHLSTTEAPDPYQIHSFIEQSPENLELVGNLIRDHTYRRIQNILNQERPVASFGGLRHNNYDPRREDAAVSYGDELHSQLGDRYVEVDLLVPELARGHPNQIMLPEWEEYIPRGIRPIDEEPGIGFIDQNPRFIVIYPETPNVTELDTSQTLDCLQ